MIYLDYNATCPLRPEVELAMRDVFALEGNPSSIHSFGREMRAMVDSAREKIGSLLDVGSAKIIITSGGTEANNLAIWGSGAKVFAFSSIEHDSILKVVPDFVTLPVGSHGGVKIDAAEKAIKKLPAGSLISVMLVNNETGVIQPIKEIAEIAHAYGCLVHTDAIQAVGRISLSFRELGVDMMSVSAHKFGGPVGVGILVIKEGLQLRPHLKGGGQEYGMRAGTVSAALVTGMAVALESALKDTETQKRLQNLRDTLENDLQMIVPDIQIYGKGSSRINNTTCVSMPHVDAEIQVIAFDLAKIAVSAGSACSSGAVKMSHVLRAMGVDESEAKKAIRVSLGWQTKESDIQRFVKVWTDIYSNQNQNQQQHAA